MRFLQFPLSPLVGLAASAGILLSGSNGVAAERVVLKYGILQQSVPVAALTTFAETGELTPALDGYGLSGNDSQKVREALTKKVKIDARTLDRGLNNPLGEALLDNLGEAIHTPTGEANRQALRAALVLSASDDGQVSLLEVVQKYPTQDVHVEGDRVISAYNNLSRFERQIRKVLDIVNFF
ncbi:alpha/beta hydrolase [Kovacikia minuta CCNUW1]|uniref:alpha/beta hydrolase n=1 Tax=Kovacikia minuta TaxID=2931930 RepID=UPI001CC8FFAC|nr:alpha/beta hydrolase [Kovacikia minuta]UBF28504.1 alpha/beta hydrolase [Kovacikia minuta CCNUW1]